MNLSPPKLPQQALIFDVIAPGEFQVEVHFKLSVFDDIHGPRNIDLGVIRYAKGVPVGHRLEVKAKSLGLMAKDFAPGEAAHITIAARIKRYKNGESMVGKLYQPIFANLLREDDGFLIVSHELEDEPGEVLSF